MDLSTHLQQCDRLVQLIGVLMPVDRCPTAEDADWAVPVERGTVCHVSKLAHQHQKREVPLLLWKSYYGRL